MIDKAAGSTLPVYSSRYVSSKPLSGGGRRFRDLGGRVDPAVVRLDPEELAGRLPVAPQRTASAPRCESPHSSCAGKAWALVRRMPAHLLWRSRSARIHAL